MPVNKNLQNRSIGREFFRYALPSVLGMVASSLYTVIDGIFVGRGVGENALGSVNIVYPFIMLQIALTMMLAAGGANLFSFKRGAGDSEGALRTFTTSLIALAGLSVVVNLLALLFAPQLCTLLGADQTLLGDSVEYLRYTALFGILYMPGLGLSIYVRNDGAPTLEMIGTLAGAVTNIFLDYLFIMVLPFGVAGAAIATGIGQMVSVAIYASHFLTKKSTLKFVHPGSFVREIKKILYNGFPSFLMEFSQSAVALSFNLTLMARMGALGVSAYSIVMYVCSIFNMVLIGIVQGAQPILSFSYGAGRNEDVKKVYRMGLTSNLALSAVFYLLILIFGSSLAVLFIGEATAATSMAAEMMRVYFLGFFPVGVTLMNILYFQAVQQEKRSILISFLRCIGFVQLFLLILPNFIHPFGIYISFFAGELLNCGVSVFLYLRAKHAAAGEPLPDPLPVPDSR